MVGEGAWGIGHCIICCGLMWQNGVGIQLYPLYVTASLGKLPGEDELKDTPVFPQTKDKEAAEDKESSSARVAQQTNTLMSLIKAHDSLSSSSKTSRVWLGDGLGSIPKRVYDRMLRWEFMDMSDFRPRSSKDPAMLDSDVEKLVVLPGFEVSQPRKRPVNDFITWVQCFCRYTAAMSKHHTDCTPGFMSHLLTVLKAFNEVEHPAWREYDEAYREKMANKTWSGMDVTLYQELCGSRQKQRSMERRETPKGKRPLSGRDHVCWLFNDSVCPHSPCKFPHVCELCRGNHPKRQCARRGGSNIPRGDGR